MLVERINTDGSLGTVFAPSTGVARGVAVQPDGKVLVAGSDNGAVVRRFLANGTLDTSFGSSGTLRFPARMANAIAVGPCGDIVVGRQRDGG